VRRLDKNGPKGQEINEDMRIYDEKNFNVLDSSHFRFIELEGSTVKLYNAAPKENVDWDGFQIEYDSEEEATAKFDELAKEVGWFEFSHYHHRTLLNTFCFRRFYLEADKDKEGNKTYILVFWNGGQDKFRISYNSYESAVRDLKALVI